MFRVVLVVLIYVFLAFRPAFSDCPSKNFTFLEAGNLSLIKKVKVASLTGAQGIETFNAELKEKIALASGYWDSDAVIFDLETGRLEKQLNFSGQVPSGLLASVHHTNNELWWSSYRDDKIFVSDLDLNIKNIIPLPSDNSPVGLASLTQSAHVIMPSRNTKQELYIIPKHFHMSLKRLVIRGLKEAAYDVEANRGCLFFIESTAGKIWTLEERKIFEALDVFNQFPEIFRTVAGLIGMLPSVKPKLWFDQSERIQHAQIHQGVLYVIDTDAYSVITIDLKKSEVKKHNLPLQHIFRGLAVTSSGDILLTGFEDKKEITESRTAIFQFRISSP